MNIVKIVSVIGCMMSVWFYLIPGFLNYTDNPLVKCKLDIYCSKRTVCDGIPCYKAEFKYLISVNKENQHISYESQFIDNGFGVFTDEFGYDYHTLVGSIWHPFYINADTLKINAAKVWDETDLVVGIGVITFVLFGTLCS